ncbi:MAG: hypothetical protein MRJ92_10945 [Nitrospira sp.]|nr:hypothetical protein [Nitrospira sp.]
MRSFGCKFGRDNNWGADIVSVTEWCEATTVRRLLSNARSLDGRDLSLPESVAADSGSTMTSSPDARPARCKF